MTKRSYKKMCMRRWKLMMDKVRSKKENAPLSTQTSKRSILSVLPAINIVKEVDDTNFQVNREKCNRTYSKTIIDEKRKNNTKKQNKNPLYEDHSTENGGEERRIVDIQYYTSNLLNRISKHSPFNCGPECIEFHSEQMFGISSKIFFLCKMCNTKFSVYTCDPKPKNTLDLNTAAVTGMTVTGIGLAQLSELLAAMNLPQMSQTVYSKTHKTVSKKWEKSAIDAMEAAAQREREAAIEVGQVKDGVAVIDVIADGCWGKRSYRKNYSSLSGAAAIIGRRFGEVLFLGVRNKYCSICAQAEKKCLQPKEHTCYKNYIGPSTNMESDIIVEGFKHSMDMYGIIYGRLIGDGDCNTYSKILESRPYSNVTVEKIECKNHLLRNMCNKLSTVASDQKYPLAQRKMLTTQRILAIRKAICLSIKENSGKDEDLTNKVNELYRDILNSYNHAFGDHSYCKPYYCKSEKKNENLVPTLRTSAMWNRIQHIVGVLAANSRSLIHDVNSNRVEGFNSVIAKVVGGKRTNLSSRQTYQTRCHAAVVSFNTKRPVYTLQKNILGFSPKCKSKLLEERRIRKNTLCNGYARRKVHFSNGNATTDKNYGESCQKPDLPEEEMTQLKEAFLKNLDKTQEEKKMIERATVLQRESSEWLELRRQLLTASNFGKIIKKRDSTNASIVKALLYKRDLSNVSSIKHGIENERNALNQLSAQLNVSIQSCGLFIDPQISYLGATPDGLIAEDQIVEIKCPLSTITSTTLQEAVQKKKLSFYKLVQDKLVVNKNHDWFYQVQGQLHITRRKSCVFAIWMGENRPLQVENIIRDTKFFKTKMLSKLKLFYFEHILPEILDPRHTRHLPLRGLALPKKRQGHSSTTLSPEGKKRKTTNEGKDYENTEISDESCQIESYIDFVNF